MSHWLVFLLASKYGIGTTDVSHSSLAANSLHILSKLSHIAALYGKKVTLYVLGIVSISHIILSIIRIISFLIFLSIFCEYWYSNSQSCSNLLTVCSFFNTSFSFARSIFSKLSPITITDSWHLVSIRITISSSIISFNFSHNFLTSFNIFLYLSESAFTIIYSPLFFMTSKTFLLF